MTEAYVVGVGQTKFGELWDKSLRDLGVEAINAALGDAKIDKKDVQSLFVGNFAAGRFAGQEHVATMLADHSGMTGIPAKRFEGACASGAIAFRSAWLAIKSGLYDIIVVAGVEKMTDIDSAAASGALMCAGDVEWEVPQGLTFAGLYALVARRHMYEFGTTREQLAAVSVNNHKNGVKNECAQFRSEIKIGDVLTAPMIADPLGMLDCSPITDGAAALVIVSDKLKNKFENPIKVLASEQAGDTLALHDRKSLTELNSVKLAGKKIFENSGLNQNKIGVLEVHDCFSINEILCLEGLGFCEKGKGGKFVEAGKISLGGNIPTNTTGGLKSIGHPIGATGIRQICDLAKQLGGHSINQLGGLRHGLAVNVGGIGATAVATLLTND